MSSDARRPARRPNPITEDRRPDASDRRRDPRGARGPAVDPAEAAETALRACGGEIAAILAGDDGGRARRPRAWSDAIATATRLGGDDVVVRQILVDLDVGADQLGDPRVLTAYVRETARVAPGRGARALLRGLLPAGGPAAPRPGDAADQT